MGNRTIKTQRVGSFLYKITDNQKDAEDTLKNLDKITIQSLKDNNI